MNVIDGEILKLRNQSQYKISANYCGVAPMNLNTCVVTILITTNHTRPLVTVL